jgi:hypothetical protein
VTPFELAYASPRDPPIGGSLPAGFSSAETDNANLRYVGVTSNFPEVGSVGASEIYFAINTYGLWGSPSDVEFDVYLRQAGAPDWQYVLINGDAGSIELGGFADLHYSYLYNLATGAPSMQDNLNGVSPTLYFLPTFMSDTMVLPVLGGELFGATGVDTAIEYQVVAFSNALGLAVDMTPVLRYDMQHPAFATTIDPSLADLAPGATGGYTPFRVDASGKTFTVNYDLDRAKATQTGSLLLIHHHNAKGLRPEVVAVTGLTCASNSSCAGTPTTPVCDTESGACVGCVTDADCLGVGAYCDVFGTRTCLPRQPLILVVTEPPGANCATGGVAVSTGYDNNHNGVLDPSEILTTSYVCNGATGGTGATGAPGGVGATGATGPTGDRGAQGSSGCSSVGGSAISLYSLLALAVLPWRRRRSAKPVAGK